MSKEPSSIEIRTYQVGFGDCFLLSFVYGADDKRHVLIDFGTSELPPTRSKAGVKPSAYMPKVADHIRQVCGPGSRLTAVVATHRHSDHISGFGTHASTGNSGNIVKGLRPRLVLQPWTEDPDAGENAKQATRASNRSPKSFIASLTAMHSIASHVVGLAQRSLPWMSTRLRKQLLFLGMTNIANESAVRNLIDMGQAQGSTAEWLHHGSRTALETLLPGVKVHVLGPPDLRQTERIRSMRKTDPDQFWHLLAGGGPTNGANPFADGLAKVRHTASHTMPSEARWFCERLQRMQGAELLQIVRSLDTQMNNTSLILLFEVFGKRLLFPGDAQIENWTYALEDAADAKETRSLLRDVDVYKVGHHGSLNATPRKMLWEAFTKLRSRRLRTLLSTLHGKHGSTQNHTEVPRKTLLSALETESLLQNTDDLTFGANPELCYTLTITP